MVAAAAAAAAVVLPGRFLVSTSRAIVLSACLFWLLSGLGLVWSGLRFGPVWFWVWPRLCGRTNGMLYCDRPLPPGAQVCNNSAVLSTIIAVLRDHS